MATGLKILALEPYFGGVHAALLDGLRRRSRHRWSLLVMPAGKWPWRMRGSALHLAAEAKSLARRAKRTSTRERRYSFEWIGLRGTLISGTSRL